MLASRRAQHGKFIDKLGGPKGLKVCYEAGPTGYALYWQLEQMGVECEVVAPSLIPKKAGERIKTDRRDAEKLAECSRAGMLTSVWVVDSAHEALRDLVRARSAAKKDETRAKHRLTKYLLRYGLRHPDGRRAWTHPWWRWVQNLEWEHEAQDLTFGDCVAEVLRLGERVARIEKAIDRVIESAPPEKQAVIEALQAPRGVAEHHNPHRQSERVSGRGSTERRILAKPLCGSQPALPSPEAAPDA